jgi:hypothetical protein
VAVIERSGAYHCGACGSPRERFAETLCLTDAEMLRALEARSSGPRRWLPWLAASLPGAVALGWGNRLGGPMLVSSVLAGLFAALILALANRRFERRQARRRTFEIEQRIIGLAYQNDGVLREDQVSTRLRISLVEARAVLQDLARQERAIASGQGRQISEFRFNEARRTQAIRRRSPLPSRPDQSS